MPSTITAEKDAARKAVKRISLTPKEKADSDKLLFQRFLSLPQVTACGSILLYYGVGSEPDTAQLLSSKVFGGKVVSLPRCLPGGQMEARQFQGMQHLASGPFGIPEPDGSCPIVRREHLSVILVPGLAFDRQGYRLGHGGGYYDRYLSGFSGLTVGLCRDKLLLPSLPTEPHDRPVDLILTETRSLSRF